MARGKDVREVMDAMTSPDGLQISGEGGVTDYNDLDNLPKINSVELKGNKTLSQLGIQEELVAGDNITITGNEISAIPTDLSDYAKKEDVYDKDAADAKFQEILTAGDNITIVGNEISAEQPDVSDFVKATSVYLRPEADVTFQKALTAGDNIIIVNDTISAEQPDVSDFVKATAVYLRPEADVTFQKTLTAGDNIVIDTVTGEISAEQPDLSSYVKTTAVYLKDQADIKFQEKLTAGYGIDATDLATNQVTVKVDNDTISFNTDGALVANGGGTVLTGGAATEIDSNDAINVKVDGTTIQINASNELEAVGGGSGTTYTAGDGIDIDANNEISAKLAAGANVTLNTASDGTITIGAAGGGGGSTTISAGDGIAVSATAQGYEVAADPDGTTIGINASGKLESLVSPGQTLGAGSGIEIDSNDDINVKLDGTTIHTNASGELEVIGGGGGGGSVVAGDGINITSTVSGDEVSVKLADGVDGGCLEVDSNGQLLINVGDGLEVESNGIGVPGTLKVKKTQYIYADEELLPNTSSTAYEPYPNGHFTIGKVDAVYHASDGNDYKVYKFYGTLKFPANAGSSQSYYFNLPSGVTLPTGDILYVAELNTTFQYNSRGFALTQANHMITSWQSSADTLIVTHAVNTDVATGNQIKIVLSRDTAVGDPFTANVSFAIALVE